MPPDPWDSLSHEEWMWMQQLQEAGLPYFAPNIRANVAATRANAPGSVTARMQADQERWLRQQRDAQRAASARQQWESGNVPNYGDVRAEERLRRMWADADQATRDRMLQRMQDEQRRLEAEQMWDRRQIGPEAAKRRERRQTVSRANYSRSKARDNDYWRELSRSRDFSASHDLGPYYYENIRGDDYRAVPRDERTAMYQKRMDRDLYNRQQKILRDRDYPDMDIVRSWQYDDQSYRAPEDLGSDYLNHMMESDSANEDRRFALQRQRERERQMQRDWIQRTDPTAVEIETHPLFDPFGIGIGGAAGGGAIGGGAAGGGLGSLFAAPSLLLLALAREASARQQRKPQGGSLPPQPQGRSISGPAYKRHQQTLPPGYDPALQARKQSQQVRQQKREKEASEFIPKAVKASEGKKYTERDPFKSPYPLAKKKKKPPDSRKTR